MPEFSSEIPRRRMLRETAKVVGAGCLLATLESKHGHAQKLAKAEARYQDHPNGPQHCAVCAFYLPPVACQVVRGEVSPNGWCDRFQPKSG